MRSGDSRLLRTRVDMLANMRALSRDIGQNIELGGAVISEGCEHCREKAREVRSMVL